MKNRWSFLFLVTLVLLVSPISVWAEDRGYEPGPVDAEPLKDQEPWDQPFGQEPEVPGVEIADPLEPWNRMMFAFNDKAYFWFFEPIARGYGRVVPRGGRVAVSNFFHNALVPVRLVNAVLQWKGERAGIELVRFGYNSTIGVLGFFDAAKRDLNLERNDEDLRQTLGSYGIGHGLYILWPFLGPSSLRDTAGLVGDSFLNPVNYIRDGGAAVGVRMFDQVNALSLRLGEYEDMKAAALDPYTALRDAYAQYMKAQIEK
ncbi:MAG: VacJ family lipoprotein [bacterium]|nr:VacJ family lipoprotein [bacterium]